MRSVVLVRGLLHGMGNEVPCEMLAMRESSPETTAPVYSRCSVIDAPLDLPDGDYTVTFAGCLVTARKQSGLWVPDDGTARPLAPALHNPEPRPRFRVEETTEILPALKNHVA